MSHSSATVCLLIAFIALVAVRKCQAQLGQSEPALSVALSDDDQFQAVGFCEGRVEVVNLKEKQLEHKLTLAEVRNVWTVEFSPIGRALAIGGGWPGVDGEIKVFSLAMPPAELLLNLSTEDVVRDVEFSSDGALLASGGEDEFVRLWDAKSGREVARFRGHDGATTSVVFAGDKNRIVSSGYDGVVRQWIVGRDEPVESFVVGSRPIVCVRYSNADASIFCCSVVEGVSQWSEKGERMRTLPIPEGIGGCHTLALDPNQEYIFGITSHGYLIVWDRPTGKIVKTKELGGSPRTFCISSDGNSLGFASRLIDDRLQSAEVLLRNR